MFHLFATRVTQHNAERGKSFIKQHSIKKAEIHEIWNSAGSGISKR